MLRVLLSRLRATLRRRRLDEELDAEIRQHLALLQQRFVRAGLDPVEARAAARRQFGGLTRVTQEIREQRGLPWIDAIAQDVRHAGRRLRTSRQFTIAAAATLALGMGATTAVFAVVNRVVLQPLPYAAPDRLVAFRSLDRRGAPGLLSYPDFFDFRRQTRVFEGLVSYRDTSFVLTDAQPPVQVIGEIVAWDLFTTLGVEPALGRGFLPDEERPGSRVAVLGHALWTSRFGADPGIVGKSVPLNGVPFTIVGVAPSGFQFPIDLPGVQVWVPLSVDAASHDQRGARMLDAIARLEAGVLIEQARTQMDLVAGALARQYPAHNSNALGVWIQPELTRVTSTAKRVMWVLLAAVGLVLLIACVNVASLLLARCTERAREFALQIALGASRAALARSLLIESLVVASIGTAGGLLVATGILHGLVPLAGERVPRLAGTSIDLRVFVFSAVLAVLTSVLFGLAPAVQASRTDPVNELKDTAGAIVAGGDRFRGALVVAQIALGLVLLLGAELSLAGFLDLVRRDPGFQTDHLLTFNVGVSDPVYPIEKQIGFCDRLFERVAAIPGVQAVAIGTPLPLQGHEMRAAFDIEARPTAPSDRPRADFAIVTPGYFRTMGIPLLAGRDFERRDTAGSPPVVIVNQAFARKFFPRQDPIGRRIHPGLGKPPAPWREIVGIAGDAQQAVIGTEPDPIYYLPYRQLPWFVGTVVVRTTVPPLQVEAAARAVLASLDPNVPMQQIRTGDALSAVTAPARFVTVLMGGFAGIAVLLTATGLYGVLSYMVAKRRREIGVRIALGARRTEVVHLVACRAARLVAGGLITGSIAAFAAERVVSARLISVQASAPLLVLGACVVLLVTSSIAALVPALRAASGDPMLALRSE